MAFIKASNKDESIAEFSYNIYEDNTFKVDREESSYNIENGGLIRQMLIIDNIPGEKTIFYPIDFKKSINGIFPICKDEEMNRNIRILEYDLKKVKVKILPNINDYNYQIKISAIGY